MYSTNRKDAALPWRPPPNRVKPATLLAALVALFSLPAAAALPGPAGFSFAKGAKFTVAGYTNENGTARSTALSGFPVLVRFQANAPVGFSYADLQNSATGADLCFVDMAGNGLPFEIDTWDASGESLVWVRLPTMTNGTEFVMCWGGGTSGKTVCDESPFSGYVGVWHMSEASGTVADSSGNGFAATPSGPAAATACVAVSGPVGNGRQCSTALGAANLSYLSVPSYDSKSVGDTFAVSGWFNIGSGQTGSGNDARLFSRKENHQNGHGWEVLWKTSKEIRVRGAASGDNIKVTGRDYAGQGWKHFFIVYDGKNSVFYENGVQKGTKTDGTAATDNGRPLGIGGYANDNGSQLVGSVDECRLFDAVPTADWVKAEYDSIADAAFLTAGEAESYGALVDLSAGVSVSAVGFTNATASVSVQALGDGASSADVLFQLAATADFAAPIWSTNYAVQAAGTLSFPVAGLATNAAYFARALVTNSLRESVSAGPASFTTLSPGAPMASAAVSGRTASSISATVSITAFGAGSDACTARLEASTDGFATVASFAETALAAPGSVAMEVSGLSPFTAYALRLRLVNAWGLTTLVDLGSATTLPSSGLAELYVDSLGSGNGSSPESALPTIREALDIAGPGCTIWVHGGADRAYGVTNETDTLPIPATLAGLSIRAYEATPGDGGRALVVISDTYIEDGNRANIVSNGAENVTLSGLDFAFGPHSVGKQDFGSCAVVWIDAPFASLENCSFRMSKVTGWMGSGASTAIVETPSNANRATNLVVRGCSFYNTRTVNRYHNFGTPIRCASNAFIAENVFSNVNNVVEMRGGGGTRYTFVSNVVYGANEERSGQRTGLLLGSGGNAEIAYNVLAADPASDKKQVAFFGFWRSWTGENVLIHHNTCIGGSILVYGLDETRNENLRKPKVFSNLFVPEGVGTNIVEDVAEATQTNIYRNVSTSFRPGSVFRNNAYPDATVFSGGSAARQVTNYQLIGDDGLFITDNIALAEPLVFVCTNDIYHADFYRYRTSRTAPVDLGVLAWRGENNEYPLWIGAKPPLYPSATMLILR